MTVNNSSDNLLEVRDLSISIREGDASYTAVDGISYEVKKGEILGMVGESGCGKTVTNLAVMGLLPAVLSVSGGKHPLRREGAYRDFGCRAQKPERK